MTEPRHAGRTKHAAVRRWPLLIAAGLAVAAGSIIAELAESVRENDTLVRFDLRVVEDLAARRRPWLTSTARAVTAMGNAAAIVGVVGIAAAFLLLRRRLRHAAFLVASSAGAALLVVVVKSAIGRPRPPDAHRLVASAGDAFPSGHAAQGVACYVALAFVASTLTTRTGTRILFASLGAVVAVAVGVSRVYLGVHWPSDVLSGWLLGAGWMVALIGLWYTVGARPAHGNATGDATGEVHDVGAVGDGDR